MEKKGIYWYIHSTSLDGGVGCGLIERDGGGQVFAIVVMTTSGLLSR